MIKFECPKCKNHDFFLDVKGSNTGLYCADCGKWIKWLNKNEIAAYKNLLAHKPQGTISVVQDHECDILTDYNRRYGRDGEMGVQKFSDGHLYLTRWSDKNGNSAWGIRYCPYCGADLSKEESDHEPINNNGA